MTAAAAATLAGYLLVRTSSAGLPFPPLLAAAAIAAVPAGLLLVTYPTACFLAAVAIAIAIPHKASHVWLLPPFLVALGVLLERPRWRPSWADLWFGAWLGWLLLRWVTDSGLQIGTKEFAQTALALGFYLFARLSVTPERMTAVLWCMLAAGTVAAASVLVEWGLGHVIAAFNDPAQYQWAGGGGEIYRPGGVFGGSPAAAIALAMILLSTLSLKRHRPWLVWTCQAVILLAIVATWARAGWIGLVAGGIVCAALLPYRGKARVVYLLVLVAIAAFFARGSIENSRAYQLGVVRPGSTTGRVTMLQRAWPLATDTDQHALVGRGFRAFMHPTKGVHDTATLEDGLILERGGPHDDYMRAILEEGAVGLILLLGFILVPIGLGLRRARYLIPGSEERLLVASLTGAGVCYAAAGLFHDLSNNVQDLTVGALVLGLLVTVAQQRSEASVRR